MALTRRHVWPCLRASAPLAVPFVATLCLAICGTTAVQAAGESPSWSPAKAAGSPRRDVSLTYGDSLTEARRAE